MRLMYLDDPQWRCLRHALTHPESTSSTTDSITTLLLLLLLYWFLFGILATTDGPAPWLPIRLGRTTTKLQRLDASVSITQQFNHSFGVLFFLSPLPLCVCMCPFQGEMPAVVGRNRLFYLTKTAG